MNGVVVIDKPKNISSNFVVVKVKKLLNTRQVGHLGTLDPLATGVLPVCVGRATRLFEYFLKKQKTYVAEFTFGFQTNTLDLEGEVEKTCENLPTTAEIEDAIRAHFTGKILQTPPAFSSKKIDGKKAYDLARQGKQVTLKPKEVEIFDFEILGQKNKKTFEFKITCSSGTYIRSLARDLGESPHSCATMTNLKRTMCGNFTIENALNFDTLTTESLQQNIIPLNTVLKDFESIEIEQKDFEKLRTGTKIAVNWVKTDACNICVVCCGEVVGIGDIAMGALKMKTYLV